MSPEERDPSIGRDDPEVRRQNRIRLIREQLLNEGLSDEVKERLVDELQELENLENEH
jgi:hypothetical protein